ncbi:hypothetical protein B0A58_11565 [Flavobacterium branchiophilum NBRC 15030 = ATCC 35035]|uniref:Uncharacterized protein n=1 Tax=Flavobacterium branchiophilum TaxID=55197 RepID=A0A543G214_9FLAO|nr:hypothetical protein [Flavobacterium branchiophilum]OXA73798.1 hypothetical protein B0A58_11565 [Flavobacterium branchiophilum NBRC 15030 = ATCC 35035]TQM40089.1 hypothetical protein BC670_0952 [Flavobacterium branchiophilum]GEM55916.1 hypothetical protein FB1_21370 [Flavobacterium branchiophilum NBRC 15030 = ATCC 35035]
MKYSQIREEELKNKVGADWFKGFDTTEILGNIDFTVFPKQDYMFGRVPLLWAEAKTGNFDVVGMFVQLILTIGKARTFDKTLPPAFLGAFDFVKMAFVPYSHVQDIFYLNDFNWNVAPSNHETKEFQLIKERIEATLKDKTYIFDYEKEANELHAFIKNNIANASTTSKLKIDKNNFIPIYLRWLEVIKPIIDVNWDDLKKANILDSDFYLADLFVDDNDTNEIDDDTSIRDNLFVVFNNQGYKIAKENLRQMFDASINLKSKETYQNFWKIYKRPPINEYHDYFIERRDLLVPQDIRERKGAFFTPRIWVELSQKYLTDYLGENWQEDYFIWDCAAGTGNLLAGLNNKYHIYASTLDQADVNVMHERIEHGANLLKNNVFQFDFLNDEFLPISKGGKMPDSLFAIIANEEKRKKLVVYINPPYAEATTARTVTGTGENKSGVTTNFKINEYFKPKIGAATNEIFALFMATIYEKIPGCILGQFSKLKFVNGSNFKKFKDYFLAEYGCGFIVPAETFDNVKGKFPIGFTVWNTAKKIKIKTIKTDVFDKKGNYNSSKKFYGALPDSINKWIKLFDDKSKMGIGFMENPAPDFQNNSFLSFTLQIGTRHVNYFSFKSDNLIQGLIYFSVRNCIEANWMNDRDQYLYPNDGWQKDKNFQNDCLAFALFHGQNRISSKDGTNHWIPFTEYEVNAQAKFESNFMTNFIKSPPTPKGGATANDLFSTTTKQLHASDAPPSGAGGLIFSAEAKSVFDAGRELWKYYHKSPLTPKGGTFNVNASLYDIREYFQGRNDKGRMNSKSDDVTYMELIGNLREALAILADAIKPKVYDYGFLKE